MSRFIQTEDGYVNASHVVKAREGKDGVVRLIGAGGEDLGNTWTDKLRDLCGTIVPAAPGTLAFIIKDDAMGARPNAEHVYSVFELRCRHTRRCPAMGHHTNAAAAEDRASVVS